MDLQLKGKRAFVTGSSAGIGESIARTLAKEGVSVVVHGRNAERANKVAAAIKAAGGKAAVVTGDLAKPGESERVADAALAAFGGLDVLVNNAGGLDGDMKPWLETPTEDWTAAFEQNVFSVARLVRKIVPGFQKQGWGRVIQIASGVATMPFPIGPEYAAAKAAIVNASVSLAKSLGGTGVTVNTVSPGPIRTEALERVFRGIAKQSGWGEDWAEIEKQAVKNLVPNPTGRIGTVEDIANAVAFLASPLAGYVNGANLRVDGGYVTTIN